MIMLFLFLAAAGCITAKFSNINIYNNVLTTANKKKSMGKSYFYYDRVQWILSVNKGDLPGEFIYKIKSNNVLCQSITMKNGHIYNSIDMDFTHNDCNNLKIIADDDKRTIQIHNYKLLRKCLCF